LCAWGATRPEDKAAAAPAKGEVLEFTQPQTEAVKALFERIKLGFLAGDYKAVRALFVSHDQQQEDRRNDIGQALRREFKAERYVDWEAAEIVPEDRVGAERFSLWVRLRSVCEKRPQGPRRENWHNDVFLVERQADGAFCLVDSPYFRTLGGQRGMSLVADAILAAILIVAALSVWVWAGYAAFSLRPRSPLWRALVVLVPLLGAVAFLCSRRLPGRWRARRDPQQTTTP
jgi:hypothetical protein